VTCKIAGFFDIETYRWDTFVVGGFYDGAAYLDFWNEDDFAAHLRTIEGEVWAWNGGHYDAVWFLDWCDRHDVKAKLVSAGARIIGLEQDRLILRDAAALIPMTQKTASGMAGKEMSKDVGLPCQCSGHCGGYCRITPWMSPEDRETVARYLREDCTVGYDIVQALFQHAETNGYVLTSTIGGSAWATAKARIPDLGSAHWERARDYYLARDGYYGGRVYVGKLSASRGYRYDINSAYPAALSTVALPFGNYAVVEDEVVQCFQRRRPGIYHCVVDIPDTMQIPPLPRRTLSGRVCYNVGRVSGAWALNELLYALSVGCELIALKRAIIWSDEGVIFKDLMTELFAVRAHYGKKHAFGQWQKWLANSLTGKFAMKPERSQHHLNPAWDDIRACNPFDPVTAEKGCIIGRCSGRCRSWEPIGRGNIWVEKVFHLPDCGHVQWAAYLTAETRIKWHKAAMLAGADSVIYGDTDSIYCTNRKLDAIAGCELGEWSYDGPLARWECLAPKTYSFEIDPPSDDETPWVSQREAKGKGLPGIDALTFERFKEGETIETDRGVWGFRTAARRGMNEMFKRKNLKRKRHARDRIGQHEYVADRRVDDNGINTRPITVAEQERRERGER